MLNCLFSFLSAEILSNLGSPHSVHEDAEKQPQADVKEGKNRVAASCPTVWQIREGNCCCWCLISDFNNICYVPQNQHCLSLHQRGEGSVDPNHLSNIEVNETYNVQYSTVFFAYGSQAHALCPFLILFICLLRFFWSVSLRWWSYPTLAVPSWASYQCWMHKPNQVDPGRGLRVQNPSAFDSGKDVG